MRDEALELNCQEAILAIRRPRALTADFFPGVNDPNDLAATAISGIMTDKIDELGLSSRDGY